MWVSTYLKLFTVTQVIGLVGVILMIYYCVNYGKGFAWRSNPKLEFNWHPLLFTIGMVFLYGNSMLIYRTLRGLEKLTLKWIHAIIHLIVIICIIVGLTAVFDSHNFANPPSANLFSLHSWIGIVTVAVFALQWIIGFAVFLHPGGSLRLREMTLSWHVAIGIGTFIAAIISVITGLFEKAFFSLSWNYTKLGAQAVLLNSMGIIFFVYCFLVVYLVTKSTYKRTQTAADVSSYDMSSS